MSNQLIIAVKFKGEIKLFSLGGRNSWDYLQSQVRSKWGELQSVNFSMSCSVGVFTNCCLESDNNLLNLSILCDQSVSRVVAAELCILDSLQEVSIVGQDNNNLISPVELQSGELLEFGGVCNIPSYDICPVITQKTYLTSNWSEQIKVSIGAVFTGGVNHIRDSLCKNATHMGFNFKYKKNKPSYIHVLCSQHIKYSCDWHIRAKGIKVSGHCVVYKANLEHKCVGNLVSSRTKRLRPKIIGDLILNNVKSQSNWGGKDAALLMLNGYGLQIPYYKAWRAVECAKEQIYGNFDDSYNDLVWYCKAVELTNPSSIVSLEYNPTSHRFERVFIAFKACIEGFKFCRPMLFIDGTFLKGRAKGTLLVATAKDGNNGLFPVAFALVSAENTDNWAWFLTKIRDNINHGREIYYISDRNVGLLSAFNIVFEKPVHFYCLWHLLGNLRGHLSSGWSNTQRGDLRKIFTACAYAPNIRLFNENIEIFKQMGGKLAEEWLSQLPYEKWAFAHSPHIKRYGKMTSNATESLNSWAVYARELPVTRMFDWLRQNIARWFIERRQASDMWNEALVPKKQGDWDISFDAQRSWVVTKCPNGDFEVMSNISCIVNLEKRHCSCLKWEVFGFPCSHVVSVISRHCDLSTLT